MRAVTIDALLTRAVYLGSLDGQVGTGLRHTEAEAFAEANSAFRAMIAELEKAGFDWYRDSTDPASLPAVDSNFDRRVISWTATQRRIVGVDVRQGSSSKYDWRELRFKAWTQRHRVECDEELPKYYTVKNIADAAESGEIHLLPGGSSSGQYVVHFALRFDDFTTGESMPFYCSACEDWCAAELAWRMAGVRDGDADERSRALRQMQSDAMATMKAEARVAVEDSTVVEIGGGAWADTFPR